MLFNWILARLSELGDERDVLAIDSHNISVMERSVEGVSFLEKMLRSGNLAGENVFRVVEMIVDFKCAEKRFRLDNAEKLIEKKLKI